MKEIIFPSLDDHRIRKNAVGGCSSESFAFIWVLLLFGEVQWEREKEFCVLQCESMYA